MRKRRKGRLIVIDGTDGSGKATQVKLLSERLEKTGYRAECLDFPQYQQNFFGKFLGECQTGRHGDFLHLDPHVSSVLYAADRFESKKLLDRWLAQGRIVILDRYVSSNQIHQGGKIRDTRERKKFLEWIEKVEYEVFGLPRPDAIVYLDVPVKESRKLLQKKGQKKKKPYLRRGEKDIVENDQRYLEASYQSALHIIKNRNSWLPVRCVRKGELLPKEVIAEEIWQKLKPQLH